jgi:hypothetical protein
MIKRLDRTKDVWDWIVCHMTHLLQHVFNIQRSFSVCKELEVDGCHGSLGKVFPHLMKRPWSERREVPTIGPMGSRSHG